jgi:acetyl esterase
MHDSAAEPLYKLLRQIRRPVALRELIAVCLRHIYMGDPFSEDEGAIPPPPPELFEEVNCNQIICAGVRCLVYSKSTASTGVLLYMHGGGFVVGCPEDSDYITRRICHDTGLAVVSVDYSLAPESIFPRAIHECLEALEAVIERGEELGLNHSNVFVGGDSAGGNLALSMAIKLQQRQLQLRGLILLAPWLDMHLEKYGSYNRLAPEGIVYDAAFMGYARAAYVRFEDWENQLASPILCDPTHLPPVILIGGNSDPLLDQFVHFSNRAQDAGCSQIDTVLYEAMPHCFYAFPNLFHEEVDCYARICAFVAQHTMAQSS